MQLEIKAKSIHSKIQFKSQRKKIVWISLRVHDSDFTIDNLLNNFSRPNCSWSPHNNLAPTLTGASFWVSELEPQLSESQSPALHLKEWDIQTQTYTTRIEKRALQLATYKESLAFLHLFATFNMPNNYLYVKKLDLRYYSVKLH